MDPEPVRRDTPTCSFCREPAVIHQRQAGRYLCGTHLIADLGQRVSETIASRQQVVPGDCVAVALSGGKDSTALLLILHQLFGSQGDVRLVAVTVDEGISGYREATVCSAVGLVKRLGVEHITVSFEELYGQTLDTLLNGRESQACSICGILRKKALVAGAERAGATKLATGHNLDDEAQSVLMNVLRGDLMRLVRDSGLESSGRFIPRIKPLMYVQEKRSPPTSWCRVSGKICRNARTRSMPCDVRCGQCSLELNTGTPAPCSGSWRTKRRSRQHTEGRHKGSRSAPAGNAATRAAGRPARSAGSGTQSDFDAVAARPAPSTRPVWV